MEKRQRKLVNMHVGKHIMAFTEKEKKRIEKQYDTAKSPTKGRLLG